MKRSMINFFTMGIVLGLSAGFSPGPLLALLISETLQHGTKAGVKVAIAPIIGDLPLIVLTYFILAKLSNFHDILGVISMTGGVLIFIMGYKDIRSKRELATIRTNPSQSLAKGILVNALNPYPYLFWFGVGAPTLVKAMAINITAAFLFIFGFYTTLVGSKVLLAILVGKSTTFLHSKVYIYIVRFLGLALCGIAFILVRDGLKLLGLI
jgi:threonine/homoserine/homoserine lactone efflux protein